MAFGLGIPCGACGCVKADCFSGISPATGSEAFNNAVLIAGGILVGASSATLSVVTIYNDGLTVAPTATFGGGSTNAPTCRIYSNDTSDTSLPYGPKPNPTSTGVLATLTPPASFSSATWTYTHSGLSLSANTIYWVVMSVIGNDGYWKYNDYTDLITASSECYCLSNFTGNAGASWAGNVPEIKFLFDYS